MLPGSSIITPKNSKTSPAKHDESDLLRSSASGNGARAELMHNESDEPTKSACMMLSVTTTQSTEPIPSAAQKRLNYRKRWFDMYEQLKRYKKDHGDCLVPHNYHDAKFVSWVNVHRSYYSKILKKGDPTAMSQEPFNLLKNIGFFGCFKDKQWMETFDKLKRYIQAHGPVVGVVDAETLKLQSWSSLQRNKKKLLEDGNITGAYPLNAEKIRMLNSLGFRWERPQSAAANDQFPATLVRKTSIITPQSSRAPPEKHDENGPSANGNGAEAELTHTESDDEPIKSACMMLSVTTTQNTKPNPSTAKLSLNEHRLKYRKRWFDMYEQLKRYKKEHGDCLVSHNYHDAKFVSWVQLHRNYYSKILKTGDYSAISQERFDLLKNIDFFGCFKEKKDKQWMETFDKLKRYIQAHGPVVGVVDAETLKLQSWSSLQRNKKKLLEDGNITGAYPLNAEKIRMLNSLGFRWENPQSVVAHDRSSDDDRWKSKYADFEKFKEEHRECEPEDDGVHSLGRWVNDQRKNYRWKNRGKPHHITDERIEMLSKIGFVWDLGPSKHCGRKNISYTLNDEIMRRNEAQQSCIQTRSRIPGRIAAQKDSCTVSCSIAKATNLSENSNKGDRCSKRMRTVGLSASSMQRKIVSQTDFVPEEVPINRVVESKYKHGWICWKCNKGDFRSYDEFTKHEAFCMCDCVC